MGYGLIIAVIVFSLIPIALFPGSFLKIGALPFDKTVHAFTYAALMLWFAQIHPKRAWIGIALGFFTLGVTLEVLQGMTEYRYFSYADIGANTLGVLAGWGLSLAGLSTLLYRLENRLALATPRK